MIRGIIFDMDGVIIDSNTIHYENWNSLFMKKFKISIGKEEFASRLGENARDITEYFLKTYKIKATYEDIYPEIFSNYEKLRHRFQLKPGTLEALKRLSPHFKLALATGANKIVADYTVTNFNIAKYFSFIIGGDQVEKAKPEPEIFLKAAEALGIVPQECVVIEDARLGLLAAKKAGMFAIGVADELTRYQDHSMADLRIQSLDELESSIKKLA